MKISVIVPVYKIDEDVLKKSIGCIINQSFDESLFEILLIDDGSPDNCGYICDHFAKKKNNIKVFHTENKGVSHARNIGINYSHGEYICFVDPDDYIDSDMILNLYKEIIKTDSQLSICNYRYGDSIRTDTNIYQIFNKSELKEIAAAFIGGHSPKNTNITGAPWGKLYKKSVIEENECYFDEALPRSQDNEFNFRYIQYIQKCCYIDKKMYQYNIMENSAMRKYWKNAITNADILLEKLMIDIQNSDDENFYYKSLQLFIFGKVEDILYTNIVHKENEKIFSEKLSDLKKIINSSPYKEYLSDFYFKDKSIYRKSLAFFINKKIYMAVFTLAKFRVFIKKCS